MLFEELSISPVILSSLHSMGYKEATPIQEKAIPPVLEGRDLIALAETGSGKTSACAIPVGELIDVNEKGIQGLILVPTRELAFQYATEVNKVCKEKGVKTFAIMGGEDMDVQKAKLRDGVHVLIATPGRLIDLIYNRHIDLTKVKIVALDEADQMMGMGFFEDLEFILDCMIQTHQTLLFSATMPKEIEDIAVTRMREPLRLSLISDKPTPKNLKHKFLFCPSFRDKMGALVKLLKELDVKQGIIFANSRREVEELHKSIKKVFPSTDFLHGGLAQGLRSSITYKFARGKLQFLIASDIAARGLDFSQVTHVVNMHFPHDQESYLHRSGRTGRSGREGMCVTLIAPKEFSKVRRLIQHLNKELEWIGEAPKGYSIEQKSKLKSSGIRRPPAKFNKTQAK
jgi:ATP-dependent RNA helicase DeaD